ncbi:MAG: DUF4434 domain-containing protein [Fibrobacterota bacterium]
MERNIHREQNWWADVWDGHATADFAFFDIAPHIIDTIPTQSWISPTTWPGSDVEPLKRALDACQKADVSLWIGLYLNEDYQSYSWWDAVADADISSADSDAVAYHIHRSCALIDELGEKFASHPAFAGFYYSIEVANNAFIPQKNHAYLAHIIDTVAQAAHAQNSRLVMSPYFNTDLAGPEEFGAMWENVLTHSDLDIIALQDGVGVEPLTLTENTDRVSPYYEAVRNAAYITNTSFWANIEVFTNRGSRADPQLIPGNMDKISLQLERAAAFSDTIISFSFQYMDPNPGHTFSAGSVPDDIDGPAARQMLYDSYRTYLDEEVFTIRRDAFASRGLFLQDPHTFHVFSERGGSVCVVTAQGREIFRRKIAPGKSVFSISRVLKYRTRGVYFAVFSLDGRRERVRIPVY